jgi:hypothetical protein
MHAANRAAPKILDALLLIGSAREDHIAFAMCGLSPDLQRNAREAANLLKPVANRLVSRRIATELRIEFRALRASTKFPDEVTCIDLSSPYNFPVGNGDLLRLLIEQCTPSRSMEGIRAQQGNGRNPSQYKLAILLAQVSHGWAAAVREWRQERCMFSMLAGEKATLTVDDDSDLARDRRRNDGTDGQLYRGDYLCASAFARLSGANTVGMGICCPRTRCLVPMSLAIQRCAAADMLKGASFDLSQSCICMVATPTKSAGRWSCSPMSFSRCAGAARCWSACSYGTRTTSRSQPSSTSSTLARGCTRSTRLSRICPDRVTIYSLRSSPDRICAYMSQRMTSSMSAAACGRAHNQISSESKLWAFDARTRLTLGATGACDARRDQATRSPCSSA